MQKAMIIAIVLLRGAAQAQTCSSQSFTHFANVESSVRFMLANPGLNVSFFEKAIVGAGDSAAVAIVKNVTVEEMKSKQKELEIRRILEMAFQYPRLIETCSDREPRVTKLLLEHLDNQHCAQIAPSAALSRRPNR